MRHFIKDVLKEYDHLWNSSVEADEEFIRRYEEFLKSLKTLQANASRLIYENAEYIVPNRMQKQSDGKFRTEFDRLVKRKHLSLQRLVQVKPICQPLM